MTLESRSTTCYYDAYGYRRCRSSTWGNWGRWLALGLIVAVAVLFFVCACITSRRRRKRGARPFYGTGWMAPAPNQGGYGGQPGQYNNQAYYTGPGQEMGNYGANTGVGQPKPVYQPPSTAPEVYQPPPGPPPGQYR
jgi:hypothetical protein